MQSSAARWQSRPGNYDALNTEYLYPAANVYGIPALAHVPQSALPEWLVSYGQRLRSNKGFADGAVHFFVDDYRFETVWSRPRKALQYLRRFNTLLTPDFSLYRDVPLALQIWNTYRTLVWRILAGTGFHGDSNRVMGSTGELRFLFCWTAAI
jgi:hypothetical protein